MKKLFGLLIIALCVFMASCESRSGQMARIANTQVTVSVPNSIVKIVLIKRTNTIYEPIRQFRVKKVGDNSIYFWSSQMPYDIGDTVSVKLSSLQQ